MKPYILGYVTDDALPGGQPVPGHRPLDAIGRIDVERVPLGAGGGQHQSVPTGLPDHFGHAVLVHESHSTRPTAGAVAPMMPG